MAEPKKRRLAEDVLRDPEIARMLDYSHRRPEFWEGKPDKKNSLLSDPAASIDDIK